MPKFTVYHADPPRFGITPKVVRVREFPNGYTRVARLEATDAEDAYQRSQTVEAAWINQSGVKAFKLPARSTSCGDIIVGPRGQKWYVAWVGLYALKPDRKDPKVLVGRAASSIHGRQPSQSLQRTARRSKRAQRK